MNIHQYKKYSASALLTFLLLAGAQTAFAGPTPTEWFNNILNNILTKIVWPIFLGLVIIMFIWAGILFLTAQGDPTKISQAKRAVVYGIIGIIVAIFAFGAVRIIGSLVVAPPAP